MTIEEILKVLEVKSRTGPVDRTIKGISYDSRLVREGFIFVAVKGYTMDGHDYIDDAVSRGAAAVIAEIAADQKDAIKAAVHDEVSFIEVSDSREALARISSAFYGNPSERLSLIGITGTNGKTTTSFITKKIIESWGQKVGLLGTVCYMTGERTVGAANTTPESLDLQRYLDEMVRSGIGYAVLEVSSHALALKRAVGASFRVAAFTNFSQDHLDFHGTMDRYLSTKSRIFDHLGPEGTAVLNIDDPVVRGIADRLDCEVVTCGIEEGAMIRAENIREQKSGTNYRTTFDLITPDNSYGLESKFIGRFNVYNILISAGIAYALGIDGETIRNGIRDAEPVEGRFEPVEEGQDFLAIVDYAHTDDALRNLLIEVGELTEGKIITVFGCGGDRDRTKRPLMGAVATELSDHVIITSDNPRGEDPVEIMMDIVEGVKNPNYALIDDREESIRKAVSIAKPGDTVVIAGKGHEDYQEIKGIRHRFSDKEVLSKELRKKVIN